LTLGQEEEILYLLTCESIESSDTQEIKEKNGSKKNGRGSKKQQKERQRII